MLPLGVKKSSQSAKRSEVYILAQVASERKVLDFVVSLLGEVMHRKRAQSIGLAVFGCMRTDRLGSSGIGTAMAAARGKSAKHGIKQIDRLVGNDRFDLEAFFAAYVPWVIGSRGSIVVSMDWTEYPGDGQSRIALNLVTRHGRATPLVWATVESADLKGCRNTVEDEALLLLSSVLPAGVHVTILADRGFGDEKLYRFLQEDLGWDYVIRFKGTITVESSEGERTKAKDLVPSNGRVREIPDARVTHKRTLIGAVVLVKKRGMKEAWHLATSLKGKRDRVVRLYGRRFTCEENFRDEKNGRFGLGSRETRVSTCVRRDRFLAINALATVLVTLLGAAGEIIGIDRHLKASSTARRTHSLFRQGREYLRWIIRDHVEPLSRTLWALVRIQPFETAETGLI